MINVMPKLYLTGYEKESIEQFITKLLEKRITTVIDVRKIPLSRKPGFSKNSLRELLKKIGINYYHFPKLGSPTSLRKKLKEGDGDYLKFFKKYRNYVKGEEHNVNYVIKIVKNNKISSLLCFERNESLCHRTIIADEIQKKEQNLRILAL